MIINGAPEPHRQEKAVDVTGYEPLEGAIGSFCALQARYRLRALQATWLPVTTGALSHTYHPARKPSNRNRGVGAERQHRIQRSESGLKIGILRHDGTMQS